MKIISELTGQEYKTVDECLAAEKKFKKKKEKEERERQELQAKKDAAYKKAIKACDEYLELCGIDIEHTADGYTVKYCHNDSSQTDEIFEDILNTLINW